MDTEMDMQMGDMMIRIFEQHCSWDMGTMSPVSGSALSFQT